MAARAVGVDGTDAHDVALGEHVAARRVRKRAADDRAVRVSEYAAIAALLGDETACREDVACKDWIGGLTTTSVFGMVGA